ncbi:MAG: cysteine desulfurase [Planctomycetes bacterium]|nr:cysteine desulfurase [Planctomycetota bacterium]
MNPDLYLDYNGSTPVDRVVAEACSHWLTNSFGNAAAQHPAGLAARHAIDAARQSLARLLGAEADEIWFTSGGTESNNWALTGVLDSAKSGHLCVSEIEHKSVLRTADALEARGFGVSRVPVGADGRVRVDAVARALRPETRLVSLMLANNETGVLQPFAEVAELCRSRGILTHCDAVCAIGKVPVDVRSLGCDLLSLSAHKLYAPKGVGLLYVRRGVGIEPLIHGCGQQCGMRSGSENTPGAVAFGVAAERALSGEFHAVEDVAVLRDELWKGIRERAPDARINGAGPRLPNTLSVAFPGKLAADLQAALGQRGISVAAGAAASNGAPSHVLMAMGLGDAIARSTLRFSLGRFTTRATLAAVWTALEASLAACEPVEVQA